MRRLFLAIPLSELVRRKLYVRAVGGVYHPAIKWTKPENLHITLVFFGNVDIHTMNEMVEKLNDFHFPCFDLYLKGITLIKRRGRLEMIWADFFENESFLNLALQLHNITCTRLERTPKAHITLARVKSNNRLDVNKDLLPTIGGVHVPVTAFGLYESKLSSSRSAYSLLKEWALKSLI